MTIPSQVPWVALNGTTYNLNPMPARADGITRRVSSSSAVGYPMTLATLVTTLPTTSSRKYKVNRIRVDGVTPRYDAVLGDFIDQFTLIMNLPAITVAGVSEQARAESLNLMVQQYLHGSAYLAADISGGKYSLVSISDLLTGQA